MEENEFPVCVSSEEYRHRIQEHFTLNTQAVGALKLSFCWPWWGPCSRCCFINFCCSLKVSLIQEMHWTGNWGGGRGWIGLPDDLRDHPMIYVYITGWPKLAHRVLHCRHWKLGDMWICCSGWDHSKYRSHMQNGYTDMDFEHPSFLCPNKQTKKFVALWSWNFVVSPSPVCMLSMLSCINLPVVPLYHSSLSKYRFPGTW